MSFSIFITMAAVHLAYPDHNMDKFFGTNPNKDNESFILMIKRKTNFAFGDAPTDEGQIYGHLHFRKKGFFPSSAARQRNGMEAILKLPPHGMISKRNSLLHFQID